MPNTPHTAPAPGLPNDTPMLLLEQTMALLAAELSKTTIKPKPNDEKSKPE